MLYGHALDALLAPQYRTGSWHTIWLFQRGLTSCLFLLLSGFAFSIATTRHWPAQLVASPVLLRRARRFGLFILIGYALHFPVVPISALLKAPAADVQRLWAVDVLHLIGVTFVCVQVLVMVLRSRSAVTAATLLLAAIIPLATPSVWNAAWPSALPPAVAAYMTPAGGSLFPLFPWATFILLGVALGQLYSRWDIAMLPRYATAMLLVPGGSLLLAWVGWRAATGGTLGTAAYNDLPAQVLLRVASCLLILAAVALVSRRLARLPSTISAVAQETLIVYVVHICIVYGSVWNPGLAHAFALRLSPWPMLVVIVALVASMTLLASVWHRWKHMHPKRARVLAVATGVFLLSRLLMPM
jgi:hypothetical protein